MPLLEINEGQIVQLCATCDAHNELLISTLTAGIQRDGHVEPRIIALPPCSICGSCEFLIRSAPEESDVSRLGSYGHLHRLLVDALHAQLIELEPAIRAGEATASPTSRDEEFAHWFPVGLRLSPLGRPKD